MSMITFSAVQRLINTSANLTLYNIRHLRSLPRKVTEHILPPTKENPKPDATRYAVEHYDLHRNNGEGASTLQNNEHSREDIGESIEQMDNSFVPTFNLAAYVKKSPTLQQLIQLGVDLHQIERRKGLAEFMLRLDFDLNVKPLLHFLHDHGVPAEAYGEIISKNPLIFKVTPEDMHTRMNYLESKNFTAPQRARILQQNPYWLMFTTKRIDRRLGHFQKEFRLSGDDVRFLSSKQPRLITYNMDHVRQATFCIREEMGFRPDEVKCLLLHKPRLWMMKSDELIERFAYAHKEMQLSHDMLLQFPEVLLSRLFRLRQRHEFLKLLGRAQYNPQQDLYTSPRDLSAGSDVLFARDVAKSDMKTYELFLATR